MATTKKKKASVRVVPQDTAKKRVFGSILLDRFANEKLPASLSASHKAFAAAHDALKTATTAIQNAHSDRSHAEGEIVGVDKQLTAAIHSLANAFVGAGIGTRQNPFKSFSKHSPSRLAALAYSRKVKEARTIVKKLKPKKLPPAVTSAIKALGLRADAVANALGAISKPGVVLGKAQRALAPVAAKWNDSYARLKTLAAAAWIDEPETFKAIFAKAAAVQAPKKKKPATSAATAPSKASAKRAATSAAKAAKAAATANAKAAKAAAKAAIKAEATTSAPAAAAPKPAPSAKPALTTPEASA